MNTAPDLRPTLLDITKRLTELIDIAAENDGELTDELLSALNEVEAAFAVKVDRTLFVRDTLLAVSDQYKHRAQRLVEHSKMLARRAERLAGWVQYNMEVSNISKMSTDHYATVAIRVNPPSIEIDPLVFEQNKALDHLWRVVREPDKTAIKAELAKGTELPGARLVTGKTRLDVR